MALDGEFFDGIYIEVVKKKYYEAGKVQEVFKDIRRQAEELNEENRQLRSRLAELNDRRVELGDTLLSAQTIYQDIIDRAKERAAAITAAAEEKSAALLEAARRESAQQLAQSRRQEEDTVRRVEAAFRRMKQLHMSSIEALNAQWQDFLCSLDPGGEEPRAESAGEPEKPGEALPADLEEKVGAIAEQVFSLEEE